jgi:hypothetical protein
MTEFYSLLRKSIESRGLKTAAERKDAYDQARRAVIRKLWSREPRLPEDEIARRIAFFDAAVERIEGDLEPAPAQTVVAMQPPAAGSTPAHEGYDRASDYAPAMRKRVMPRVGEAERADTPLVVRPLEPVPVPPPPESEQEEGGHLAMTAEAPVKPEAAPPVSGETDAFPALFQRAGPAEPERATGDEDHAGFEEQDEFDAFDRAGKAPRARLPNERDLVRILAGVIAGLSVFLVGFGIYVFYPRSSGPAVAENVGEQHAAIGDAKTAAEIPRQAVGVVQSFSLFDGRDPQVFVGTPDNPIRFDKDKDGSFTRVSSTADAAGARAVIGPGLANRLAGQTIRVTLTARSSREGGADTLRFAYQSGLAVSHWQVARVSPAYGEIGLIWRVPVQRTSKDGDVLLIEPGIPGDGSGVDIKSIRIDLIKQS